MPAGCSTQLGLHACAPTPARLACRTCLVAVKAALDGRGTLGDLSCLHNQTGPLAQLAVVLPR